MDPQKQICANQYTIFEIMRGAGWSAEKTNDLLYKMETLADKQHHIKVKEQHQRVFGTKLTVMITISFDNKMSEEETINQMNMFIQLFKQSDYKWCENACYCFEFFSSEGWNPHIHLVSEKNDAPSTIAKAIKRSPAYKKSNVYNVNVKPGNDGFHYKYIQGDKKESKEENIIKDEEFRQKHKLKSYYIL